MKKRNLIFLIPALVSITACGLGQEVKAERAEEIAKNMAAMEDPKNMDMRFVMNETEDGEKTSLDFAFKVNEDQEIYGKMNLTAPKESDSLKLEMYVVKDDTYGKVAYAKMYNYETKRYEVEVMTYKNNATTWNNEVAPLISTLNEIPSAYYFDADQLQTMVKTYAQLSETDDDMTVKFYSTGDNNLSIQISYLTDKEPTYNTTGTYTITFDKGYLKSLDMAMKYQGEGINNALSVKGSFNYPSSLKISLPSDWKNYL